MNEKVKAALDAIDIQAEHLLDYAAQLGDAERIFRDEVRLLRMSVDNARAAVLNSEGM